MRDEKTKPPSSHDAKREKRRVNRVLRPAIPASSDTDTKTQKSSSTLRVLLVDLNNCATFPTMSIGILISALREHGHQVRLLCPLAYDVPATVREKNETFKDEIIRRARLNSSPMLKAIRETAVRIRTWKSERAHPVVIREVEREIQSKPDVILLSAYLMHFNSVQKVAAMAKAAGIPVLLGGPMFNLPDTANAWREIDGINAVVGAETDLTISELVEDVVAGRSLLKHPGVMLPDGRRSVTAPPFRNLDAIPLADYTDFPWDRYPQRIIPMMTGRGCQWDKCLFCSDVVSAAARTFRTKSVQTVLLEMQELSRRHQTRNFIFLDLKLNSYPGMLRGIAENIGDYVKGAEWIGTVHVDLRDDNGLSREDLFAAVRGGMRRISFGFESGSQSLLDRMHKGSNVERNSQFIRDAYDAGLSVRCSMFSGFPSETAEDMAATVAFLREHEPYLDRIRFVDFKLSTDTPIYDAVMHKKAADHDVFYSDLDFRRARAGFTDPTHRHRDYRKEVAKASAIVHQINKRQLRNSARQFDGMM